MKNSIIVGLIVIALIVSNIPSARAEPITLTVMAIVGVVTVVVLAAADEAIHDAGIATADSQQKQATEMVAKHGSADVSGIGHEAESMTAR
jgi:hypothetical protein